jgi:hypothetical protein
MKPFVGQMVQYRFKPEHEPCAAVITRVDGEWVSLQCFTELGRWVPHVEYALHCKEAKPDTVPRQWADEDPS